MWFTPKNHRFHFCSRPSKGSKNLDALHDFMVASCGTAWQHTQTERHLLLGAFPKEKHSMSPVSRGHPPLTVPRCPVDALPSLSPQPRGRPPLTVPRRPVDAFPTLSPDAPWMPSPLCSLTPRGRPHHTVPQYPVDALPLLSPHALWTPSPQGPMLPCRRPPLTVPRCPMDALPSLFPDALLNPPGYPADCSPHLRTACSSGTRAVGQRLHSFHQGKRNSSLQGRLSFHVRVWARGPGAHAALHAVPTPAQPCSAPVRPSVPSGSAVFYTRHRHPCACRKWYLLDGRSSDLPVTVTFKCKEKWVRF